MGSDRKRSTPVTFGKGVEWVSYDFDKALDAAISLSAEGRDHEALQFLRQLESQARTDNERISALYMQVHPLAALSKFAEAKRVLRAARNLEPYRSCAIMKVIVDREEVSIHWFQEEYAEALKLLYHLLTKNAELLMEPDNKVINEQMRAQRGILLGRVGRFEEAIPDLEIGRDIGFWLDETLYFLGSAYLKLGRLDEAKFCLSTVQEADANSEFISAAQKLIGSIDSP